MHFCINCSSDLELDKNIPAKTYEINTLLRTLREFKTWKQVELLSLSIPPSSAWHPFPTHLSKNVERWLTAETTAALLHHYRALEDASMHDDAIRDIFVVKPAE